jgi:hypothetical protein
VGIEDMPVAGGYLIEELLRGGKPLGEARAIFQRLADGFGGMGLVHTLVSSFRGAFFLPREQPEIRATVVSETTSLSACLVCWG